MKSESHPVPPDSLPSSHPLLSSPKVIVPPTAGNLIQLRPELPQRPRDLKCHRRPALDHLAPLPLAPRVVRLVRRRQQPCLAARQRADLRLERGVQRCPRCGRAAGVVRGVEPVL